MKIVIASYRAVLGPVSVAVCRWPVRLSCAVHVGELQHEHALPRPCARRAEDRIVADCQDRRLFEVCGRGVG